MKIVEWICRIALGGGFIVFGALYFMPSLPPPPPAANEVAQAWIAGLAGAPYYLTMVKVVELLCGVLILSGIALPLSLVMLAPIVINLVYFNTFLSKQPGIDLVLLVLGLVLASIYRARFKPLFQA
jgi:uncharacterized membrane protein YphA (DoxX/SURF4 family)